MTHCYSSEEHVLSSINQYFPHALLRQDDTALLPHQTYVTSVDIVGENLDFRLHTFPPYYIGYKALAVNISDIIAMGALPRYFLMAVSLPQDIEEGYFTSVLHGMSELAQQYDITLIGGDIAFENVLRFAITIFGTPINQPIRRGNASIGDCIFYIPSSHQKRPLGLARVGFEVLEAGGMGYESAVRAQHCPALVDIDCIDILAPFADVLSLMDCSDGLLCDIPRLIASSRTGLGAEIVLTQEMLHSDVVQWCEKDNIDPYIFAYHGGEEYCLLGTAPLDTFNAIQQHIPDVVLLGHVRGEKRITCNGIPMM